MSGDGYPLDIALSADGTQLMCSFVYLQGSELKNRVVFYDFSEIGKNVPNRLVGGFDDEFQGDNLASPELLEQRTIEERIDSVFYSDEYAAAIVRNTNGEYGSRLEVYKKDGTHVLSKEFNFEYTHADFDGDLIILYNEDSCRIYNMSGTEKFDATFDFPVSKIRKGRFPGTLVVTGPQQMQELKLR